MNWIKGWDRQQQHLLPERVEDYVGENNPVRFLSVFIDSLDLRELGFVFPKENAEGRGRPAYHPGDLLKLYLYGYLHQIRSSRRLEEECQRNLEVMWLLGKLQPDFKTIADFRKVNAAAFKKAVRQFTLLCQQLNLFGKELLVVDGTKIKGQNAKDQNWSESKLQKQLKEGEEKVAGYLKALEEADTQEASVSGPTAEELKAKIEHLKKRQNEAKQRLKTLKEAEQTQVSATDPDSRGMKGSSGHMVGYNVQGAVDGKHHLLVVAEVTNEVVDQGQLRPVVIAAKEELRVTQADVVADGGYFKGEDIKACQEIKMEPHLRAVENSPSERAGLYGKNDFAYDARKNTYQCPAGAQLTLRRTMQSEGKVTFAYDNPSACQNCRLKKRCTQAKHRTVSRWEHEESLERMADKVRQAPEKMAARKTIIEHVWGTIKWLLPGGFLLKGLTKVQAEMSLVHFSYNLKRALAVVGLKKLLQALKSEQKALGAAA